MRATTRKKLAIAMYIRRRINARRHWVHPINVVRAREGEFLLYPRLRQDEERFFDYFRMETPEFDNLLALLRPILDHKITNYRETLSTCQRLQLTLR
jgi:hypothetical protein